MNCQPYPTELARDAGLALRLVLMRRAIAASCALVALGAACSGSKGSAGGATTTVPPTTAARPPTTTTTARPTTSTLPPPDSLAALIVGDVQNYTRESDDVGDTGPTGLEKAALDDACISCNPRAELTSDGFESGYQRQWLSVAVDQFGNPLQAFLFLYRFQTPAGAQRYAQHWQSGVVGAGVAPFTPAFIPGAVGLTVSDSSGSTGIAIFTKGQYAVKAQVTGGPNADQSGPAGQLALAQYGNLP